LIKPEFL